MVLNPLPTKLKDPDSFSISCIIGNVSIDRALCDLGSSVSLKPTHISLQLADHSIKYPMGVLEDVPIKVGDFYVPIDIAVLDMTKDSCTQIILGRPFLATARCTIDVKEGKLTFDVGEHHVEFGLFKDCESSSTFPCCRCEVFDSNEPVSMIDITLNDPSSFDCTLSEGSVLDGVMMDSLPSCIIENRPYAADEGCLRNLYRFVTLMMFMPPVDGIGCDVVWSLMWYLRVNCLMVPTLE